MMSGPLVNNHSQTAAPFQFPFIVLLHGGGAFFNLQPSLPSSTSILVTNFIPHRLQLQSSLPTSPSSPTSTLIAFNFNPRCLSISKPRRFSISSPSP
jgi:hypothetical protein